LITCDSKSAMARYVRITRTLRARNARKAGMLTAAQPEGAPATWTDRAGLPPPVTTPMVSISSRTLLRMPAMPSSSLVTAYLLKRDHVCLSAMAIFAKVRSWPRGLGV
jgi:hypothetical protein